jgi:hypothetical protein
MRFSFSYLPLFLLFLNLSLAQNIFRNSITGVNSNNSNPYTFGQETDPNIDASGISRGVGVIGVDANNRYDAKSWNTVKIDPDAYFEFILSPNSDQKIDFISFRYTGQISINGPIIFAFRSSIDGFVSDIGVVGSNGSVVSLLNPIFQNISKPITFRLYAWAAIAGTGTFSVNDFEFKGSVSCNEPPIPLLQETSLNCTATSFVVNWSNTLYTTNYFIDVATDSEFVNRLVGYQNKELGNVLFTTISGMVAGGTYYVRLNAVNSCKNTVSSNIIKVSPSETFYNGSWSNGLPTANKNIRYLSDCIIDSNMEACSCTIDSDSKVTVNSGVVLKLENGLDVKGVLTFENDASLVQVNDNAINSGAIVYKRNSQPMRNFDYTYWSSPVSGQTAKLLSPNTLPDKYYRYDCNADDWTFDDGIMTPGVGYIIRVPKPPFWPIPTAPTYIQSVEFIGTPNNNITPLAVGPNGYGNLIGNPYPSGLNADEFLLENSINHSRLEGTLRFWSHNTSIANNKYSESDFASYSILGGVAASSGGEKPFGTIASGQSFFVLSSVGDGPVVFNNKMRVSKDNNNQQFFKGVKSIKLKKHRIWLNLTNAEGAFRQLLIGYITNATNEFDISFDGLSINNDSNLDFYSIIGAANLVIQGRALPFAKSDIVPLGYKSSNEGPFNIKIDKIDGLFENQNIYLEDKETSILHDLKLSSYSFSTKKGTFDNRFVLRFSSVKKSISKPDPFDRSNKHIKISIHDCQLQINAVQGNISKVLIYDLKGNLLFQKEQINSAQLVVSNVMFKHQILIVKTYLDNGENYINKVVF